MKQSYSLFELNEYIRRVVALNFPEPIWINCEISQINESRSHYYLELVEQNEEGNITAQISAAIWYKNFLFIKNKLGNLTKGILQAGSHVLLKVEVDFNERYGLKLSIVDIDPGYTLGKLEISRQQIIDRLKEEGKDKINPSLAFSKVPQRIAVISSSTAAGYIDFIEECRSNQFGYHIATRLFDAAMQGANTEEEVSAAFDEIARRASEFDAVVLIRGGGSKLDLSHFDNYKIASKIAGCALPVLTGIGHDIDFTVADMVAHKSFKTPTAVAGYLIDRMAEFEYILNDRLQAVMELGKRKLEEAHLQLKQIRTALLLVPASLIQKEKMKIDHAWTSIKSAAHQWVRSEDKRLIRTFDSIQQLSPDNILAKGYAYVTQNNAVVPKKKALQPGDIIVHFSDGSVESSLKTFKTKK